MRKCMKRMRNENFKPKTLTSPICSFDVCLSPKFSITLCELLEHGSIEFALHLLIPELVV